MDIAIIAALGLLLLFTLVAFGVGHKRWSFVSVTAAFLIALAIPTYLVLAALLLDYEWRWAQAARRTQEKLIRVHDALAPSTQEDRRGRLVKVDGMSSLRELTQERDRWQRALDRVDNWRGRHWANASFNPPTADDQTGAITLPPASVAGGPADDAGGEAAADAPAEGAPPPPPQPTGAPVDPGATVYVFDDTPFSTAEEGGMDLGAFVVRAIATDEGSGRQVLTVQQTAPRDRYDTRAWSRAHDSVTVYTELPSDRWLAFSQTPAPPPGAEPPDDGEDRPADRDRRTAPQPRKRLDETLDMLVPEAFRDAVRRHALSGTDVREPIDKADWPDIRQRIDEGKALPGEYWAEVTFGDRVDLEAFLKVGPDDIGDDAGLSIEMDFPTALEQEAENKLTIDTVFYRRPLIDGQTLLHGSVLGEAAAGEGGLASDGVAALRQVLEREKAVLEIAQARLATGLEKAQSELGLLEKQATEFNADLVNWQRDVDAATKLADRFEAEAGATRARLRQTEQAIVDLGRELTGEIDRAVRDIDKAAPPPAGRGAAAPATAF